MKVLGLLLFGAYAIYGIATGNLVGTAVSGLLVAAILWGMFYPQEEPTEDSGWVWPWLVVTAFTVMMWWTLIYSIVKLTQGVGGKYVFTAIAALPLAILFTRILVPANIWVWRRFRSRTLAADSSE